MRSFVVGVFVCSGPADDRVGYRRYTLALMGTNPFLSAAAAAAATVARVESGESTGDREE